MSELCSTATRLRMVKRAYHEFLTLWAVDRGLNRPGMTDRIFDDIDAAHHDPFGRTRRRLHSDRPNADN